MRNEPTDLEILQRHRIEALEQEVLRLNLELNSTKLALNKLVNSARSEARKITVSDPAFLSPLSELNKYYGTANSITEGQ